MFSDDGEIMGSSAVPIEEGDSGVVSGVAADEHGGSEREASHAVVEDPYEKEDCCCERREGENECSDMAAADFHAGDTH